MRQWDIGEFSQGVHKYQVRLEGAASGLYFLSLARDSGFGMKVDGTFKLAVVR